MSARDTAFRPWLDLCLCSAPSAASRRATFSVIEVELGNAAEWIGAIGTVGTLAAAVWVAKQEVDNRRADTDERERRQASKVSCWVELGTSEPGGDPLPWIVTVQNGSDEPIYGVSVVQDPGYVAGEPTGWWDVIPPGGRDGALWDPDVEHVDREPKPLLEFDDAAGRRWVRDVDGILRLARRPGEASA